MRDPIEDVKALISAAKTARAMRCVITGYLVLRDARLSDDKAIKLGVMTEVRESISRVVYGTEWLHLAECIMRMTEDQVIAFNEDVEGLFESAIGKHVTVN